MRRNRESTQVDVTAPLNPNLCPGDTVWFRHPELGYAENTAAIIVGIGSNGDEMTVWRMGNRGWGQSMQDNVPPALLAARPCQPTTLLGLLMRVYWGAMRCAAP